MTQFTPVSAAIGGALIGSAAVLLHALNGRVAGVSGIIGALPFEAGQRRWRLAFLAGLVAGAAGWHYLGSPGAGVPTAPVRSGFPPGVLLVAGVLVGYGTALAHGCTSGHGVCGIARLSRRSLVATATFLVTAVATTYLTRHVLGFVS